MESHMPRNRYTGTKVMAEVGDKDTAVRSEGIGICRRIPLLRSHQVTSGALTVQCGAQELMWNLYVSDLFLGKVTSRSSPMVVNRTIYCSDCDIYIHAHKHVSKSTVLLMVWLRDTRKHRCDCVKQIAGYMSDYWLGPVNLCWFWKQPRKLYGLIRAPITGFMLLILSP